MLHANRKVSAPVSTDGDAAMERGRLMLSARNTESPKVFRESGKSKISSFDSYFLLLHTLPAAQEWFYTLVCREKPNLTLQMPWGLLT